MKPFLVVLVSLYLLAWMPGISFAETTSPASPSVQERLAQETKDFNPEKVGQQMEAKAGEVMEMAKGGSFLYVAIALCIFVLFLIIGLFYRPLLKVAFLVLVLAIAAFLLIQNWEAVLESMKGFFRWLGSETKPIAPAQEGTTMQGNPL